jgi:broad specificity phosphatase PhoE
MRRLLLIRHGETDWNRESRWQGWLDRPLTEDGRRQARERARALAADDVLPAELHTSDLGRAHETARIIGAALGLVPVPHADLRERHGGDFEGLNAAEIRERYPGIVERWRAGERPPPPGGESDDEVHIRASAALDRILTASPEGNTVLVVTHGGVIRILTERTGGGPEIAANLGGRWFTWDAGRLVGGDRLPELAVQQRAPATE